MPNNKPLVSVVMPSYNHAEFVRQAIESVLAQTYANFEFIIADDASKDNSVEIIKSYRDPRIKFTSLKENEGFSAGEFIYKHLTGQYIAAIPSDDVWCSTFLEKNISILENNIAYGCCFCIPQYIDKDGNYIEDSEDPAFPALNMSREKWFKRLYSRNSFCAPSMFLRKDIFEQLGGFKWQYRQTQDFEYWLRLLQVCNVYVHPEKLIMYRLHENGRNHNISSLQDNEVRLRCEMEKKYIMLDITENVSDEFFLKVFYDELIRKPGSKGFCIDCEKFAVMLSFSNVLIETAILFYFKHYNDIVFRESLENYYGIYRKDIYKLTGLNQDGSQIEKYIALKKELLSKMRSHRENKSS